MFQRFLTFFILIFVFFLTTVGKVDAIENPLSKPNNKFGIHILFTTEIPQAAKLINSNGGDWGYVTIPIQSTDRDLQKWQRFMDQCKKYHVIPIVRLATEGDYFNTDVWRKPQLTDVIDAANFLNQLSWPTQNRYIIVYNEVNRADEWGGNVDPAEYANILSFAVTVFKSKSPDYFIISAGLDNAAPNQSTNFMNQYDYMRKMNEAIPAIFHQVDGLASHSYPNPGFSQAPNTESKMGVGSFIHERELARTLSNKELPVFITETGWDAEIVSDDKRLTYYQQTLETIWNDPGIVALTPFLLEARSGAFEKFSFLTATGAATKHYTLVREFIKTKGEPHFPIKVLAAETHKVENVMKKPQSEIPHKTTTSFFSDFISRMLKLFNG